MNITEQFKHIFEPELLNEMEKKGQHLSVKEGDIILDIGQTVRVIPLILSGTLKISRLDDDGHEILLYYVNPEESCAMTFTCCMQQFPSEVKAVAEDDVEFLAIPITSMDEWMMKYVTWKSYVMKTIRARFNELLRTIDQIAFQKLDDRLVHYLKEKSKTTGSSLINLSHEQIANELATSRVVISRLLKKLETDKKLLLYRNQIKILREL
jgi:CRP/FNR family transcriptional regulator